MGVSLIPVTVLTVVGLQEAHLVLAKKPPAMKPLVAGFLMGLGLFAIEVINDNLATMFCALLIVGSLLLNGESVFTAIGGKA